MSAAAPRIEANDVRRAVSLLPLLPSDANPRRTGKDAYQARCSFHEDDRPSMSVRLSSIGWTFCCFACGEKGDVIGYFMRTRKVPFLEAMRQLVGAAPESWVHAPVRTSPLVLACDGKGCTESVGIEADEVHLLGLNYYPRALADKLSGWRFSERWPADQRAWCSVCVRRAIGRWRRKQGWPSAADWCIAFTISNDKQDGESRGQPSEVQL